MNKVLNWIGRILTILAIFYFAKYFIDNAEVFSRIKFGFESTLGLLGVVFLYVMVVFVAAIVWKILLSGIGESTRVLPLIKIIFVSQFAKYIPGNVAHHIGRVSLSVKEGYGAQNVIFSLLLETGWIVISGFVFFLVFVFYDETLRSTIPVAIPDYIIGIVFAAIIVLPYMIKSVVSYMLSTVLKDKFEKNTLRIPSVNDFFAVFSLNVLSFIVLGLIVIIVAETFFLAESNNVFVPIAAFAISWVIGYVTPGAPGGVGVRETVLIALLSPVYGVEVAVGIATVLRIVSMLGDGLAFTLGLLLAHHSAESVFKN